MITKKIKLLPVKYRGEILDGYYMDQDGNIFSNKRGSFSKLKLQPGENYNPYPRVGLSLNKKCCTINIHRLVCETFHKKPTPNILTDEQWNIIPKDIRDILIDHISHADRWQVNHIDHNGNNYHPSNLEWVTAKENQRKFQEHRKKVCSV